MIECGSLVGKYRLDRKVGEGGMGYVFAATHVGIGTRVAVKMLKREVIAAPSIAERFMREARAAGQLKSEHVCRVLDIDMTDDGLPYMVMELLEGCDLATAVRRDRPDVATAAGYIAQACAGLAEAHRRGMVHRDIKPANLFLTTRNGAPCIKILDFGIATAPRDEGHPNLTSAQMVMGSPNYMSPEQISSAKNVDPRSDVWSLGVSLYELVSGHLPFQEPSFTALSIAIATEPHRPLADIPAELARILDRCLAKQRDQRYANAHELAVELAAFCAGTSGKPAVALPAPSLAPPTQPEHAARPRSRRRLVIGLLALSIASAATLGVVLHTREGESIDRARVTYDRWAEHWHGAHDCLFGPRRSADPSQQVELHVLLDKHPRSPAACDPWLTADTGDNAESTLRALGADDFATVDVYDAMLHLRKTIADLRCEGDDCALSRREALVTVGEADARVERALGIPPAPGAFVPVSVTRARKVTLPAEDYAGWKLDTGFGGAQSRVTKVHEQDRFFRTKDRDTDSTPYYNSVFGVPDPKDPVFWARSNSGADLRWFFFKPTDAHNWMTGDIHGVLLVQPQQHRLDVIAYEDTVKLAGSLVWTTLTPGGRPPTGVEKLAFAGKAGWECLAGDTVWIASGKRLFHFTRGVAKPDVFFEHPTFEASVTSRCSRSRLLLEGGSEPALECVTSDKQCTSVTLPGGTSMYADDELVTVEASPTGHLAQIHTREHSPVVVQMPGGEALGSFHATDGHVYTKTKAGDVFELYSARRD